MLRAGTYADAYCGPSNDPEEESGSQTTATSYSAWYEWYPMNSTNISGLTVKPGDNMFVEVWSTSPTTGGVFVVDFNTQQYVSIHLTAPAGVQVSGGSAEWVSECPSISGNLATLTNYVSEYVSGAYAADANGTTYAPADSTPVVMVDQNMQPISYPTLLGTMPCRFRTPGLPNQSAVTAYRKSNDPAVLAALMVHSGPAGSLPVGVVNERIIGRLSPPNHSSTTDQ